MKHYLLYGVDVQSDVQLFPQSAADIASTAPDDSISLALQSESGALEQSDNARRWGPPTFFHDVHQRDLLLYSEGDLGNGQPGEERHLEIQNLLAFTWRVDDPRLTYRWLRDEEADSLLGFWFVHIVFPLFLTLERRYDFMHAAAVEFEQRIIMFIAESTGGKSTMADYFLKQGHALVSDDKVATFFHDGQVFGAPSHPHHRPWREYEVLGKPVSNFASGALPIRAFYLLEQDEPDTAVEISAVSGFRKFESLLPNYMYDFEFLQKQRLAWLGQLADQSGVFRVRRPWDLGRLHEVYDAICRHARKLSAMAR
ncbi:MAG: hypothetical protein AAGB19_03490 [Cyanobacteria bacterium P01_F01_bin.3]